MRRTKVRWRRRAVADLKAFYDWLSTIESAEPKRTIGRIRAAAKSMERLGDIGRPSRVEGLRELSVRNAPYIIVHRAQDREIEILAVYHSAQDR